MILADFKYIEQARHYKKNNKQLKTAHNQNPPKNSQTRNYERNSAQAQMNNSQTINNLINTTQQLKASNRKNVYSYMDDLNIGNLIEFYDDEMEQRRREEIRKQKQIKQKLFQQSISRLYTSGLNKTSKQNKSSNQQKPHLPQTGTENIHSNQQQDSQYNHDNNDDINDKQNPPKHYYNELYPQEEGFDHKFRVKMLQNECHKTKQKLLNKFLNKYSIRLAQSEAEPAINSSLKTTSKYSHLNSKSQIVIHSTATEYFIKSLLAFIFTLQNHKTSNQIDTHQRFFTAYSDYINKFQLKHWQNPLQNKEFQQNTYNQLKYISHRLPFVYWFLDFASLEKIQQVQFNDTNDIFKWIQSKYNQSRPWEFICEVFKDRLNPKFTVPFQTKLYQVKKPLEAKNQNLSQSQQRSSPIKANPIPASTYTKPKKRAESQKKHTQLLPFNFTQTHSNINKMTADQLYSWNRNFKAKPVPKTNYQPQLMFKKNQNECDKKVHMEKFNRQSKFPKTMAYLQNYDEFQEQKRKELEEKYAKKMNEDKMKEKTIPDFQKIHKKEQYVLQKRKQMNRTNTQPKPFNFTQTKKSDLKKHNQSTLIFNQQLESQEKKKKKLITLDENMPEARSTAKFDAYIKMRKQQRQEKKTQIEQREDIKRRKENDMKIYKEILKQRMHSELVKQPIAFQYNVPGISQNMVKVNLEEIYLQRPLLMSGAQGNGKKIKQDDQKTSYTDEFEPII